MPEQRSKLDRDQGVGTERHQKTSKNQAQRLDNRSMSVKTKTGGHGEQCLVPLVLREELCPRSQRIDSGRA